MVPVACSRLGEGRVCEIEKARTQKQNGRKPFLVFLDHALIFSRALHLHVIPKIGGPATGTSYPRVPEAARKVTGKLLSSYMFKSYSLIVQQICN